MHAFDSMVANGLWESRPRFNLWHYSPKLCALRCIASQQPKPGLLVAAAREPAAQGNVFLMLLRHDSAALARAARVGLSAKSCPDTCFVVRRQMGRLESLQNVASDKVACRVLTFNGDIHT
jgi:hypothetical protein